jgi:hypothetical protein
MPSTTLVVQTFRTERVPTWIRRCLDSVEGWAKLRGYDYRLADDGVFSLCGADYLARVGPNLRSITNLARLEMVKQAFSDGYDRAVWLDADVQVFDPASFTIDSVRRYAFARETWISPIEPRTWRASGSVNNCCFVCIRGEPDLDFLIAATRHVAMHREIQSNFQVGGDLIKGLQRSLDYEVVDSVGMFSPYIVRALARKRIALLRAQALYHGSPVHAANLCASFNYAQIVGETHALEAMDRLESTRGAVLNQWLSEGTATKLRFDEEALFEGPDAGMIAADASTG